MSLWERFEEAWEMGERPGIRDFLPANGDTNAGVRREILQHLVALDMEYRWRTSAEGGLAKSPNDDEEDSLPPRPKLEDYVAQFPELGPTSNLPIDLVGQEFYVRHRWGDRPAVGHFCRQFGRHDASLQRVLESCDIQLSVSERQGNNTLDYGLDSKRAGHESALVTAAIEGDKQAVEQLLLRFYDSASSEAEDLLCGRDVPNLTPRELVQMLNTRVFQSIGGFHPRAAFSFRAWLSALLNTLVDTAQAKRAGMGAPHDRGTTEKNQ